MLEFLIIISYTTSALIVVIFKKGKEVYWSNIHEQHQYISCHCTSAHLNWFDPRWKLHTIKWRKPKASKPHLRNQYVHPKSCVKLHIHKGSHILDVWLQNIENWGFPQFVVNQQYTYDNIKSIVQLLTYCKFWFEMRLQKYFNVLKDFQ